MGGGVYEEERSFCSVVCPKPRRLGLLNPAINDHIRHLRWPAKYLLNFIFYLLLFEPVNADCEVLF